MKSLILNGIFATCFLIGLAAPSRGWANCPGELDVPYVFACQTVIDGQEVKRTIRMSKTMEDNQYVFDISEEVESRKNNKKVIGPDRSKWPFPEMTGKYVISDYDDPRFKYSARCATDSLILKSREGAGKGFNNTSTRKVTYQIDPKSFKLIRTVERHNYDIKQEQCVLDQNRSTNEMKLGPQLIQPRDLSPKSQEPPKSGSSYDETSEKYYHSLPLNFGERVYFACTFVGLGDYTRIVSILKWRNGAIPQYNIEERVLRKSKALNPIMEWKDFEINSTFNLVPGVIPTVACDQSTISVPVGLLNGFPRNVNRYNKVMKISYQLSSDKLGLTRLTELKTLAVKKEECRAISEEVYLSLKSGGTGFGVQTHGEVSVAPEVQEAPVDVRGFVDAYFSGKVNPFFPVVPAHPEPKLQPQPNLVQEKEVTPQAGDRSNESWENLPDVDYGIESWVQLTDVDYGLEHSREPQGWESFPDVLYDFGAQVQEELSHLGEFLYPEL